jgi:hypothetical protein
MPFSAAGGVLASCTAKAARRESRSGLGLCRLVASTPSGGYLTIVDAVQRLRYKDFQLALKPAPIESMVAQPDDRTGLYEVESIKDFAAAMEKRGIAEWWKRGMEFA